MKNKTESDLSALGTIAAFYAMMELVGITCPIRFLTGISCPGCGLSRAWLALLRGDVALACYYHPLFFLPVPMGLLFLFEKYISRRLFVCGIIFGCAAFFVVYIGRMRFFEDSVVSFNPMEGLIYKVLKGIFYDS